MVTTMETTNDLQANIHEAERRVHEAQQSLQSTVAEISGVDEMLREVLKERDAECLELAKGRKASPERHDHPIQQLRDRVTGLQALQRQKESNVAACKTKLYNLNTELAKAEQAKLVHTENQETHQLIDQIERALTSREREQTTIVQGVNSLRERKYLSETTRRLAMDSAQKLARRANGMRP